MSSPTTPLNSSPSQSTATPLPKRDNKNRVQIKRVKEACKLIGLIGVFSATLFAGDAVGEQIKKIRAAWELWNPAVGMLMFVMVQFIR